MSNVADIVRELREGDYRTAVDQSRQLTLEDFPDLRELIDESSDKHFRSDCYAILQHLAVSTRSGEIGQYSAARARAEHAVKQKVRALSAAKYTRGIRDSTVIESLLDHKNRDIQREAVQALGACESKAAETALIRAYDRSPKPADAFEAACALARMCSAAAINQLQIRFEALPRNKAHESTLASLALCLSRHPTDQSTALVRRELPGVRLWQLGWACLNYMANVADASDAELLAGYVSKIVKRMKRGSQIYIYSITFLRDLYPTELCACLAAVQRLGDAAVVPQLDRLVPFWSDLSHHEHQWMLKNHPERVSGLVPHDAP